MLADASNEFPKLLLQPGHKRPSQEVVTPVERREEDLSRDERAKRLRSSTALRPISITSARLNSQPVDLALSAGVKQPSKSSVAPGGGMPAASQPFLRKVPPDPTAGRSVTRGSLEPSASAGDVQATWYCDRCGRPYKWKQTLQAHRRLCGARSFACDECTERFDTKPQLDIHKRTAHEKRATRFYCWCGLSYENKSNLRRHERETHENHAPAVCEQCGKPYPRKTSLHRHIMEKHKGEKRKEDRSKSDKDKGKNDKHEEKDGKS
ncbi:hypothetical protein BU14_0084s0029 [Porphyra umbilicalis]|uniref:C2H2-type domain-containing protein n=1 Tax=Porphyra umbilicalis TaxID=2786 RepID=A0A1X6PEP3_PORUM|nr:hypothetical protein BU14_0084s0029 [Porphyra umbilicalis]|eukprot:OSX79215.1 hypothetical protein BU14_0084s0029 [Porphyra umbilicalis]